MSFNQYTWDLYKQTTIGIEMIKYFSDAGGYHLPQIVLKKRILIANYLTIRILFGAANGIRTRDPQLGKLIKVFHNHILINVLYII